MEGERSAGTRDGKNGGREEGRMEGIGKGWEKERDVRIKYGGRNRKGK